MTNLGSLERASKEKANSANYSSISWSMVRLWFINPPTFGTFFIQVDVPFETIRYCGFAWWNNCVQCWFPKWFWMIGQLIQNLVWIFPNGSTANTKPCLDTSKWWINGPSKTILNGSTACYQHCSNGITMCVQNQWAFLKVEILNGFKWCISRRPILSATVVQGVKIKMTTPKQLIIFMWKRSGKCF